LNNQLTRPVIKGLITACRACEQEYWLALTVTQHNGVGRVDPLWATAARAVAKMPDQASGLAFRLVIGRTALLACIPEFRDSTAHDKEGNPHEGEDIVFDWEDTVGHRQYAQNTESHEDDGNLVVGHRMHLKLMGVTEFISMTW
jgi:hypothetical protein